MTRSEYSPTYSELPPQEIYVDASNQHLDNVQVTTATSESDRSFEFPSARRVTDDPKTKFFTFERLTPVSTADDAREDTVTKGVINDKENGVLRDPNGISSPLTSDLSQEKDQYDDDDVNETKQICTVSSTVRERVAEWEKRTVSWRSVEVYDVPFDEDPMSKMPTGRKIEDFNLPEVIEDDDFDASKETITEIPVEDIFESDTTSKEVAETEGSILLYESVNVIVCDTVKENETTAIVQPITSLTNLLDEEDNPDINTAPSDELVISNNDEIMVLALEMSENCAVEAEKVVEADTNTSSIDMAETFRCPGTDEICTQVSKLWSS